MKKLFIPLLVVCLLLGALCACTDSSLDAEGGNISQTEDGSIDGTDRDEAGTDGTDTQDSEDAARSSRSSNHDSAGAEIGRGLSRAARDVGDAARDVTQGVKNAVK